jgi:hypothetical protein
MFLKITVAGLFLAGVLSGSIAAGPAFHQHVRRRARPGR